MFVIQEVACSFSQRASDVLESPRSPLRSFARGVLLVLLDRSAGALREALLFASALTGLLGGVEARCAIGTLVLVALQTAPVAETSGPFACFSSRKKPLF